MPGMSTFAMLFRGCTASSRKPTETHLTPVHKCMLGWLSRAQLRLQTQTCVVGLLACEKQALCTLWTSAHGLTSIEPGALKLMWGCQGATLARWALHREACCSTGQQLERLPPTGALALVSPRLAMWVMIIAGPLWSGCSHSPHRAWARSLEQATGLSEKHFTRAAGFSWPHKVSS